MVTYVISSSPPPTSLLLSSPSLSLSVLLDSPHIYHNIPDATIAQVIVGGNLFQTLPVGQAPIRGSFELSWNKVLYSFSPLFIFFLYINSSPFASFFLLFQQWNALWNGTWTVKVFSANYPSGEIGGVLGCTGTCSVPPSVCLLPPPLSPSPLLLFSSPPLTSSPPDLEC